MRRVFLVKKKRRKYPGTVVSIDEEEGTGKKLFHVRYDDGDEEDLYKADLLPLLYETNADEVDRNITADHYIARRQRAINLFSHYPVLTFTINPGRGKARDRFFAGQYDNVKVVPLTPFPESATTSTTTTTTTDPFERMFGANTFTQTPMSSTDLLQHARMEKWFRRGDDNRVVDVPYPTKGGKKLPHGALLDFNKVPVRYLAPYLPEPCTLSATRLP